MSPPRLPIELHLEIAHHLAYDERGFRFADFNSLLKVNCGLHDKLNRTLWQEAAKLPSVTQRVFTHLIQTDNLARFKFFLELGAAVDTPLEHYLRFVPLQVVVQRDKVPFARLLIEHGADLIQYEIHRTPGYSAIHAARSAEMVQLLLDHRANPEQEFLHYDDQLYRPLHHYAKRDNIEAMRVLLQNGAVVDATSDPDRLSSTPLHYAALRTIDTVKLLLQYGADLKRKNCALKTPLHLAAEAGKTETVRLLADAWPAGMREKDGGGNAPLHLAAAAGETDVARVLLERWPEGTRDEEDKYGRTPLHVAVAAGKTEMVRFLLKAWPAGAKEKAGDGNMPLHLAAAAGDTDMARLLLERWYEGTRDKEGKYWRMPLHVAVAAGKTEMVRFLLEAWPAGTMAKDVDGNTPLHLAAAAGTTVVVTVVRLLVEIWPDGRAVLNEDGQTPLALFEQHIPVEVKLLPQNKEIIALLDGVY
jgi:ankyrin repeat protein